MMLIIALVLICVVVSTAATRAAGREAVKPFGRVVLVLTVLIWAAVLLLPRGR